MKERLTGAIILVALIVLLVPELLKGPVRSAPRAVAASAEEPPLRSYTINLGDDAHARNMAAQPESAAPQPLTVAPPAVAPVQSTAPAVPLPDTSAPPAPAPKSQNAPTPAAAAPAAPPAAPEAGSGWMVQLGSFASRANAERLAHQLKGQGFTASVSRGTTGRRLYRVRVGPAHDRAAAEQLQGKLKAAGHPGAVAPR